MKTITIFGLIYHQHVSNFVYSLKKHANFRFLGLNKKADVIQGEAYFNQSQQAFDYIYNLPRNRFKAIDVLQRSLLSFIAISKFARESDVVQFHFISPFVLPLATIVKLISNSKISSFIYGSDFLRANKVESWCIERVFSLSDSIVCDSTNVLEELKKRYPNHTNKMCCLYFGSPIIDRLLTIHSGPTADCKQKKDKMVIMCGYNGTKEQQHIKIIESLKKVAKNYYWVFPMTYSNDDKEYIEKVRNLLESKDIDYIILDSFLSEEEWTNYILSTDIFIHMQVSDAFSSSISEHLLLGHILINGSWLPYKDLDDNGVFYISSDFDTLEYNLNYALSNYSALKPIIEGNREKIIKMKSLDYCIRNYWIPYFNEL